MLFPPSTNRVSRFALALCLVALTSCAQGDVGGVAVTVTQSALMPADVGRVAVSLVADGGYGVPINHDLTLRNGVWSGTFADVPVGSEYVVIANAYAASAGSPVLLYTGQVDHVAILRGQSTAVSLVLQEVPQGPPVIVGNGLPAIESVTVAPGYVLAGDTADLTVIASDPDSDALTYAYSASDGVVAELSAGTARWYPSGTPGTYSLTVTVTDAHGASTSIDVDVAVGP